MNTWTSKDIEEILMQLDQQGLPFKKYRFTRIGGGLNLLGKGGFAGVYEAELRKRHEKNFAIKVIGFADKRVDSDFFRKSVTVQKELGAYQKDVVKVHDFIEIFVWIDSNNHVAKTQIVSTDNMLFPDGNVLRLQFVVMEKIESVISRDKKGKLYLVPEKLAEFDEREILKLAYDIGNAITRAHQKNVLHRDIKLENIFYSSKSKRYKLGDFGIAKVTDDGMASTRTFTKGYAAPEVVGSLEEKYDNTADVYSFGMMLFVLSNGLKFPNSDNYNVNISEQYRQGIRLPRPEFVSDALWHVLEKMCRFDPDERYQSMEEVMSDLERLIFSPMVQYKKKHNQATVIIATLIWLMGIILWRTMAQPEWEMGLSTCMYILLVLGIGKSVLHLFEKKTGIITFAIFCVGLFYLISSGFTWIKLLFCLSMLISLGNLAGILSGTLLAINFIEILELNGLLQFQLSSQYLWMPATLLSLAFVLMYQYWALQANDENITKILFTKNIYWSLACLFYVCQIIMGWSLYRGDIYLLNKIWGPRVVKILYQLDLTNVGIIGLSFCLLWMIREILLIKWEKRYLDV